MGEIPLEDIVGLIHRARVEPNSPTIVAMRLALEQIDQQAQERRDNIEASHDVAGHPIWTHYDGGRGYAASWVPRAEIDRRRAEPGPVIPQQRANESEQRGEEDRSRREAWRRDDETADADGQTAAR